MQECHPYVRKHGTRHVPALFGNLDQRLSNPGRRQFSSSEMDPSLPPLSMNRARTSADAILYIHLEQILRTFVEQRELRVAISGNLKSRHLGEM